MANGRIKGITIEIDGSTTGLDKALKSTESNISSVQRSLKDVNRLLKIDPSNTELLSQKQKLLSQAVDETKQKLEMEKEALRQAAEQEVPADKMDALKREVIATTQELEALEKQAKNAGSVLGTQLQEAGKKISKVGEEVTGAGKKLLPVTAAVTGIGTAAVKTAADFESSMSQVQATMGTTKDSMSSVDGQTVNTMDTLSALAKKMGEETAFSASECAEALNYLALAGYDTQQMCDTLPTVLNLAAAGGIELASASDMVTDAMSALGMGVNESEKMVDQMSKTASTTNTSVAQLGEGILTIGATAKSIKGGTAELNTALGILANNGIKGAEGGTHLRNVILSLQNPTDTAAGCLEKLGVSVYDSEGNMRSLNDILGDLNASMDGMTSEEKSNIIGNIFNKTDISSVNALLANTGETWNNLQGSIENSAGAAQQMADTQLDNLNGQITILKSAVEGAAISIGEVLAPIIKDVVAKIQEWTDKFNSLDDKQKKIIVTIGAIVAAIGPVLVILGTLISSVGTITGTIGALITFLTPAAVETAAVGTAAAGAAGGVGILSSSLLPIVGIIAGVVTAGVLLYKNWDTIKEKAGQLKENLSNKFSEIKQSASEKWTSMKEEASEKWDSMSNTVTEKLSSMKQSAASKYSEIKQKAKESWSGMKQDMSAELSEMKASYDAHGGGLKGAVSATLIGIHGLYTAKYNAIDTLTGGKLSAISSKFSTNMQNAKASVSSTLANISSSFNSGLSGALSTASSKLGSIGSKFSSTMANANSTVSSAISNIRSKFNFSWSLPKLKLPHINISGKFSLSPPSVPKFGISWYKKAMDSAMILDGPTAFGYDAKTQQLLAGGEAGREVVSGEQHLIDLIGNVVHGQYDQLAKQLDMLNEVVQQYFPQVIQNMDRDIILDDGTVVGKWSTKMDTQLGRVMIHKERGN